MGPGRLAERRPGPRVANGAGMPNLCADAPCGFRSGRAASPARADDRCGLAHVRSRTGAGSLGTGGDPEDRSSSMVEHGGEVLGNERPIVDGEDPQMSAAMRRAPSLPSRVRRRDVEDRGVALSLVICKVDYI